MGQEYTRSVNVLGQIPIAGQVVLHETFEDLNNWTKVTTGGDDVFELDPSLSKHGKQSLYLKSRTTGATTADVIAAQRLLHILPSKVMTFICSFYMPVLATIERLDFLLDFYDATTIHKARLQFRPNTPDWKYLDSANAYVEVPSFAVALGAASWHQLILRANFATDRYLSLQVDHLFADLSAIDLRPDTGGTDTKLIAQAGLITAGAAPAILSLDDIIIHEL